MGEGGGKRRTKREDKKGGKEREGERETKGLTTEVNKNTPNQNQ